MYEAVSVQYCEEGFPYADLMPIWLTNVKAEQKH